MLTVYGLDKSEQWDCIVKSFYDYDVYYLSGYVKAFQLHGDGEPLLLYYENWNTRGINVVMKRDIADDKHFLGKLAKGEFFDIVTPYGYGGWLIEGENTESLFLEYSSWAKENNIVSEFVRFDLFHGSYKGYYGDVETRTHNVVRTLNISLENMWMDFKPKVRKNVKRAEKSELQIKIENTGENLSDFLDIYYSTMDRNSASGDFYFNEGFFHQILSMPKNEMFFHVLKDSKIISTELVIYDNINCYSYLGGTYREYFDFRPNDFLKFEIIKWAHEKGLKNFVLGGGYGSDDGIFQYKQSFSPSGIVDFYIGKKIFDSETYDKLVQMREMVPEGNFFPKYRA